MEIQDAIPFLGRVYRNKLRGVEVPIGARVKAVDTLVRIGVPQQMEAVPPWEGDWTQFSPDELDRIHAGEHPEFVLRSRMRSLPQPGEIVVEPQQEQSP